MCIILLLFTEDPSEPTNPNANLSSHVLSVEWVAPNNIYRFDLDHYLVQILIIPETVEEPYYFSGTTTGLSYLFDLGQFAAIDNIAANITAVSKC